MNPKSSAMSALIFAALAIVVLATSSVSMHHESEQAVRVSEAIGTSLGISEQTDEGLHLLDSVEVEVKRSD